MWQENVDGSCSQGLGTECQGSASSSVRHRPPAGRAQRLMRGSYRKLVDLKGLRVKGLNRAFGPGYVNRVVAASQCREVCLSVVECQFWILDVETGCWIEYVQRVAYPLTVDDVDVSPSAKQAVIAGEFIQRLCPAYQKGLQHVPTPAHRRSPPVAHLHFIVAEVNYIGLNPEGKAALANEYAGCIALTARVDGLSVKALDWTTGVSLSSIVTDSADGSSLAVDSLIILPYGVQVAKAAKAFTSNNTFERSLQMSTARVLGYTRGFVVQSLVVGQQFFPGVARMVLRETTAVQKTPPDTTSLQVTQPVVQRNQPHISTSPDDSLIWSSLIGAVFLLAGCTILAVYVCVKLDVGTRTFKPRGLRENALETPDEQSPPSSPRNSSGLPSNPGTYDPHTRDVGHQLSVDFPNATASVSPGAGAEMGQVKWPEPMSPAGHMFFPSQLASPWAQLPYQASSQQSFQAPSPYQAVCHVPPQVPCQVQSPALYQAQCATPCQAQFQAPWQAQCPAPCQAQCSSPCQSPCQALCQPTSPVQGQASPQGPCQVPVQVETVDDRPTFSMTPVTDIGNQPLSVVRPTTPLEFNLEGQPSMGGGFGQ